MGIWNLWTVLVFQMEYVTNNSPICTLFLQSFLHVMYLQRLKTHVAMLTFTRNWV